MRDFSILVCRFHLQEYFLFRPIQVDNLRIWVCILRKYKRDNLVLAPDMVESVRVRSKLATSPFWCWWGWFFFLLFLLFFFFMVASIMRRRGWRRRNGLVFIRGHIIPSGGCCCDSGCACGRSFQSHGSISGDRSRWMSWWSIATATATGGGNSCFGFVSKQAITQRGKVPVEFSPVLFP